LTAASKSLQFSIETVCTSTESVEAAALVAASCDLPLVVSHSRLIWRAPGTASRKSCSH
jgi:hypothetical protein